MTLKYSARGGFPQTLQLPVRIRFVPAAWNLLLSVLAGALLGSLVPLVLSSERQKLVLWLRALAAACLVAIIAWLVGLVFVSLDSRFRIFSIELDPFQIVPAGLIGVFVGLYGFRSTDAVEKFYKEHFGTRSTS